MESLVHSKEANKIRGGGVRGSTPPAFPKGSAEIVPFGQVSPFPDIKALTESIKVGRPPTSSKSEFVMEPCGLSAVTSQEEMKSGHRCRHTRGCVEVKPKQEAR